MGRIDFDRFVLDNGLTVIVHQDTTTPLACLNIMYDVGSRDENPDRTGFAHLFEHLMFGGSVNIPSYDSPLQVAGGSNNAFTSTDITNYYITLPVQNLETAFWLESDRMLNLAFTEKSLEVQRNVVVEEFRQRYLNQPYGDVWLLMRPLAFKKHPYQWATIGKEEKHIEEATMADVKAFYQQHYLPKNAVMVVAGNVETDQVKVLAEKWFSPIAKGEKPIRKLPKEPVQKAANRLEVERPVPLDAIYISFHMCGKSDDDYCKWDLLSDVLSAGKSSRLQQRLIKEKRIFTSVNAFVMGERDPSLFTIAGHISQQHSIEEAEAAIWEEIELLRKQKVDKKELEKVKNQVEANHEFSQMNLLNRAIGLAYHELLGDADGVNSEMEKYMKVSTNDLQEIAQQYLTKENSSTLIYKRKNDA
ncbi:MAG: insulinase family protein [Flavobacteriales bacterium]|nr:insulinase family protein [Flavobacteriales bacterium]